MNDLAGGGDYDVLDGGKGSDWVDGGSGYDIGIFNLSERDHGDKDYYDGGADYDLLVLKLTSAEANDSGIQYAVRELNDHIHSHGYYQNGQAHDSHVLGLNAKNWEGLAVDIDGVRYDDFDVLGW